MAMATVIALAVLGVCGAWCCGRDAGWREADRTATARMETYKDYVWSLACKAESLSDFKARFAAALTMDEGEASE